MPCSIVLLISHYRLLVLCMLPGRVLVVISNRVCSRVKSRNQCVSIYSKFLCKGTCVLKYRKIKYRSRLLRVASDLLLCICNINQKDALFNKAGSVITFSSCRKCASKLTHLTLNLRLYSHSLYACRTTNVNRLISSSLFSNRLSIDFSNIKRNLAEKYIICFVFCLIFQR